MAAEHFYFAWIDEGEQFNPAVHNRDDEDVFSFSIQQTEGDFASLTLEVHNPRIGLLNAGRKVWCFLSFDDGSGTLVNLFKGRLIGIPSNIFDTVVTFTFIARPSGFVAQKHALADTLRVLPYWDPDLLSPDSWQDDDTVLEARSALWNINPATHELTISDVLVPEDGVMEFQPTDFFYDGMAMTLQETPLRSCTVTATFPWKNSGSGNVDLADLIKRNWPAKDLVYNLIWTFTMDGLISGWPTAGTSIGSGWTVTDGKLTDVTFLNVRELDIGVDLKFFDLSVVPGPVGRNSIFFPATTVVSSYGGVGGAGFDEKISVVVALANWALPVLTVGYSTSRDYSQVLQFTLTTDTQNIITDTGGDDVISIALTSNPLTDIGFDAVPSIAPSARTYLDTPRGQLAVEHCILVARANLCIKSRAVQTTFETLFKAGAAVTCRKGCLIHDPRIPGGAAQGKVTAYKLSLDGATGAALANITIASAVGYGGAHTTSAGTPSWVDAAWVGADWQQYNEVVNLTETSDITFEMPPTGTFDDGVDLSRQLTLNTAVKSFTIENGPQVQSAVLNSQRDSYLDAAAINSLLQTVGTTISLSLTPLNTGPFSGGVAPTLSKLIIPQQINLEAAST